MSDKAIVLDAAKRENSVFDFTTNQFEKIGVDFGNRSNTSHRLDRTISNEQVFNENLANNFQQLNSTKSVKVLNPFFNDYSSFRSSADQVNLSLNFLSVQSAAEKLREAGFAEFNPMTSDAAVWLDSFENRVTEFGCVDQALSIIIRHLDEFGLDFYRQTIRLVFTFSSSHHESSI